MKILISPGFGAGWSTWSDKSKEVATYKVIIDFIEKGGDPNELNEKHPLIIEMIDDLNLDHFYTGGAGNLIVKEIEDNIPFRINEYDGSESLEVMDVSNYW